MKEKTKVESAKLEAKSAEPVSKRPPAKFPDGPVSVGQLEDKVREILDYLNK